MKSVTAPILLIFFATTLIAGLGVRPASACSCAAQDLGFVFPDGTILPANSRGMPWAGTGRFDYSSRTGYPPPKERFEVWRLEGATLRPILFEIEWVADSLAFPGEWAHTEWLHLVVPKEWVPGATYRFIDRELEQQERRRKPGSTSLPNVRATAEVSVSPRRVGDSGTVSLHVGRPDRQRLQLMSRGGMCSSAAELVTRRLSIDLPGDLEPFRSALLFSVKLWDGSVWVPTKSLCSPGIPGRSQYLDLGEELIYYDCERETGTRRTVTMTAWLPGTDVRIESRGEMTRDCPSFADRLRHLMDFPRGKTDAVTANPPKPARIPLLAEIMLT